MDGLVRMNIYIVSVFALGESGGLLLGGCLCGISWRWKSVYFYCYGYHWTFIGVFDIIGLRRSGIKISGKFGIIRLDISFFLYVLSTSTSTL